MSTRIDGAWGQPFDISPTGNHAQPFIQSPEHQGVNGLHPAAHPSPHSASHLSPPAEGAASSPCSTLEPSDSVSRTHSPPHSVTNLEEEIPRQSTDEENMAALGNILAGAAKFQKGLRMSRLAGRFGGGGPLAAATSPTSPSSSSPLKSNGTSSSNVTPKPDGGPSSSAPQKSPPRQSPPQTNAQQPVLANVDAHMMPPDPFAEAEQQSQMVSSSSHPPLNPGSPPANPFSSPPSGGNVLNFGTTTGPDPNAIPWTKDLVIVGLFARPGGAPPISEPVQLPVMIAAEPDQNVAPELWPSTPMLIHAGSLSGPTDLLNFHNAVESNVIPRCFLLPYLDETLNTQAQITILTNYERLSHTLLEKKSFIRILFPIEGKPQGTGLALYPRFDHYAGTYRLMAALFTSIPVPNMSSRPVSQTSTPPPAATAPARKIAPLPHPMRRNGASRSSLPSSSSSEPAPMDATSLLNVDRPFGDGSTNNQPIQVQVPQTTPPIQTQAHIQQQQALTTSPISSISPVSLSPLHAQQQQQQQQQYDLSTMPLPSLSLPTANNNNNMFDFPPDLNVNGFPFDHQHMFQNGGDPMQQQYGQMDASYYGMVQNEDIIMDTNAAPYSYPTGAIHAWNNA